MTLDELKTTATSAGIRVETAYEFKHCRGIEFGPAESPFLLELPSMVAFHRLLPNGRRCRDLETVWNLVRTFFVPVAPGAT